MTTHSSAKLTYEDYLQFPDDGLRHETRSAQLTSNNLQGSPDLAVEILSPSTSSRDRHLKRGVYERTGVDEYWVVDPDHDVVHVFRRLNDAFGDPIRFERGQMLTTPLLPGLRLPLDKIFA